MLRATPVLNKMASTRGGMRRILKRRLPVQKYIELAVKAGSYKSPSTRPHYLGLHDVPRTEPRTARDREERAKLLRGIIDYPSEVSINFHGRSPPPCLGVKAFFISSRGNTHELCGWCSFRHNQCRETWRLRSSSKNGKGKRLLPSFVKLSNTTARIPSVLAPVALDPAMNLRRR